MASFDANMPGSENNFNWDDIEVGSLSLDHSQHFFAQKHIKHERLDEPDSPHLSEEFKTDAATFAHDNQENIQPSNCSVNSVAPCIKQEKADTPTSAAPVKVPLAQARADNQNKQILDVTVKPNASKPPANIACQWSTQKRVVCKGAISKNAANFTVPAPPQAYQFKDIYQRRQEEALRKQLQEERKQRQFHSRPMPDFNAHFEQMQRQVVVHRVTVPVTPQVLKNSRETEEKRKQRLEEIKRQLQPPKFEPRQATVLKEDPFVPKKNAMIVVPKPFSLQLEKRLKERREYDATVHRALEEKRKQEEEERKRIDEQRIKELRKMATFKARPNPFKNSNQTE